MRGAIEVTQTARGPSTRSLPQRSERGLCPRNVSGGRFGRGAEPPAEG